MSDKNITFEIKEHLGVIAAFENGWNRELNIISWNGKAAKYDLRDWDPHHERMSKGLTLFDGELRRIVDLYLQNNSQKAVERGRAIEAERKARQKEQMQERQKELQQEPVRESPQQAAEKTEEEAYRETQQADHPSLPEGADLEEEGENFTQTEEGVPF